MLWDDGWYKCNNITITWSLRHNIKTVFLHFNSNVSCCMSLACWTRPYMWHYIYCNTRTEWAVHVLPHEPCWAAANVWDVAGSYAFERLVLSKTTVVRHFSSLLTVFGWIGIRQCSAVKHCKPRLAFCSCLLRFAREKEGANQRVCAVFLCCWRH